MPSPSASAAREQPSLCSLAEDSQDVSDLLQDAVYSPQSSSKNPSPATKKSELDADDVPAGESKSSLVQRLHRLAFYCANEPIPSGVLKALHAVVNETEATIEEFGENDITPMELVEPASVVDSATVKEPDAPSDPSSSRRTSASSIQSKQRTVEETGSVTSRKNALSAASPNPDVLLAELEYLNSDLATAVSSLKRRAQEHSRMHDLTVTTLTAAANRILTLEKDIAHLKSQNEALYSRLNALHLQDLSKDLSRKPPRPSGASLAPKHSSEPPRTPPYKHDHNLASPIQLTASAPPQPQQRHNRVSANGNGSSNNSNKNSDRRRSALPAVQSPPTRERVEANSEVDASLHLLVTEWERFRPRQKPHLRAQPHSQVTSTPKSQTTPRPRPVTRPTPQTLQSYQSFEEMAAGQVSTSLINTDNMASASPRVVRVNGRLVRRKSQRPTSMIEDLGVIPWEMVGR